MPLQLLIRLGLTPEYPVEASIVSEESRLLQVNNGAELHSIAPHIERKNTILLLPSAPLRLDTIQLPRARLGELQKAVPFALEEELCQDPQQCHFAIKHLQGDEYSVAIIDRSLMVSWVQMCEAEGFRACPMVPEVLALPWSSNQWSLLVENDQILLRVDEFKGYSLSSDECQNWLRLLLDERKEPPKLIHCYNIGQSNFDFKALSSAFPDLEFIQTHHTNALLVFTEGLKNHPDLFNLRQGEFLRSHTLAMTRAWRSALLGITVVVFWHLFSGYSENVILTKKSQQMEQQINQIYKNVFPNATAIIDPKQRLSEEYARLQKEATGTAWQHTMGALAIALQKSPNIHLQSIQFKDPKLTAGIKGKNFSELNTITQHLKKSGFLVTQTEAKSQQNHFTAQLTIEERKS